MRLFAGIDGGATKTQVVVVDAEGRERARATGGSSSHTAVGLEAAVRAIRAAAAEAARAAGGDLPVAAAWIGLAGVDRPGDFETFLPLLAPVAGRIRLGNDAELALAALPDGVGIAVIAGTGSIILGRDGGGSAARTGGWGHVFGDEGSGYEMGRQALRAASRAADGRGEPTLLLEAILEYWRLAVPSDLIDRVYHGADKAAIAQLAGAVFSAAEAGDAVAGRIVAEAADELALGIRTLARRLDFPVDRVPLALSGGLLIRHPELREAVLARIGPPWEVGPVEVVTDPGLSAARAAIELERSAPGGGA